MTDPIFWQQRRLLLKKRKIQAAAEKTRKWLREVHTLGYFPFPHPPYQSFLILSLTVERVWFWLLHFLSFRLTTFLITSRREGRRKTDKK